MRLAHIVFVAIVALGSVAAHVRAQDQLDTNSGNSYTGKILSDDGSVVEIQTDQGMTMKVPYAQLTPLTLYRLRAAKTAEDGKSQLALAQWCITKALYPQAKISFRKALAVAPEMNDEIKAAVVVARRTAANELLARGKSLQAAGKFVEARQVLSTLVQELPLEDAAKEATQLLAAETAQREEAALKRAPKPVADAPPAGGNVPLRKDGEPFSDATHTLFQPIIDSYHRMLDATQNGLQNSSGSATDDFQKAIKQGDQIRSAMQGLKSQGAGNAEVAEALDLAGTKLEEADVDARLDLVNVYILRTSYNDATQVVNQGLAVYPKNTRLLQARSEVAAASSSNSGGGWVFGGGGGRR